MHCGLLLRIIIQFNNDKTIVDSGTTDIYFPTEVFQEVKNSFSDFFRVSLDDVHGTIYYIGTLTTWLYVFQGWSTGRSRRVLGG